MPQAHTSTTDIDLAAYLMLRGARLFGVERHSPKLANFVLTHRKVLKLAADYHAHKRIKFSPKAYGEMRYRLKRYQSKFPVEQ